jgi:hypothetical protein
MAGKKKKKNKPWVAGKKKKKTVGLRDPRPVSPSGETARPSSEIRQGEAADPLRDPLPSSFFFLFSFFLVENQVLLGIDFFLCIFFSLAAVSCSYWWA